MVIIRCKGCLAAIVDVSRIRSPVLSEAFRLIFHPKEVSPPHLKGYCESKEFRAPSNLPLHGAWASWTLLGVRHAAI